MTSTAGYKPPSSQPRAPLFQTDQSPVLQRVQAESSPTVTSGSRAVLTVEPEEIMLSPPRGSSKRSPVPAFTPGFEDHASVIEHLATPAVPDPYLSSVEYTDSAGDGDRWSDFSSSVQGVFSPDPPTPMPATARRAQAKKMALMASSSSSFAEKTGPADSVEDIDGAQTPLRVTGNGSPTGVMVPSTPAAVSALLSMASGGMSGGVDLDAHDIDDDASPVGSGVGVDGVGVPRGDEMTGGQDEDVPVYDISDRSMDAQVRNVSGLHAR